MPLAWSMALAEKRHFFLNVLVYKLFISVSTHDWTGPLTGLVPYRYFGIRKPEQLGPKGARGGHD
jgi:predicted membrane chloride channel (bestrophin family)